ncbi:response regulator [Granulicella rosea]|nr:response regulator transcription factor [Granulicella rosea]
MNERNEPAEMEAGEMPAAVEKTVSPIRLLIVDDHPIVRFGLNALLALHEDIDVVGTAAGGDEALDFVQRHAVDVLLVDLRMPGCSGIETLKRLREVAPRSRSIVLSSFEYDEEIYDAVKAGAQGYLHKESHAEDILNAIRLVHGGKRAFPRRIAERLSNNRMTAGLSPREREILELVSKGLTNKEVANTLQLSQFTVRNHLNHITEKLEASDRTEAIFIAMQTGIITVS